MISRHLLLIGTGASLLAGCAASPQTDPAFTRAQAEVAAAANNPDVFEFARPQLQEAQGALKQSESAHDSATVDHFAFLASRYAETAAQIARQKKAEQVVLNAPAARNAVARSSSRLTSARTGTLRRRSSSTMVRPTPPTRPAAPVTRIMTSAADTQI